MPSPPSLVVVWGNCQAEPIATLIEGPARAAGLEVVPLPPVYEADEATLVRLREDILPKTRFLVSQPIRDEYRIAGCGTSQLAAHLASDAKVVTFPITYDTSAFPYQARAHDGTGNRIDAPLTDYHDLRAIVAAERGYSIEAALSWWPAPTPAMVSTNAERSRAEMQRREQPLDVHGSDLLVGPAMHTLSHPTNYTLIETARRILAALGLSGDPSVPDVDREFLGERRAPIEAAVVEALGWPPSASQDDWIIAHEVVPLRDVLAVQLPFYAGRPDIAQDTRTRFADRMALLAL